MGSLFLKVIYRLENNLCNYFSEIIMVKYFIFFIVIHVLFLYIEIITNFRIFIYLHLIFVLGNRNEFQFFPCQFTKL